MQVRPTEDGTDLEIYYKTTASWTLDFTDDWVPKDITGWTIYFTVKTNLNDADASAIISKDITSHSNPTQGQTVLALTITDTTQTPGNYYYDLKYKDADGNEGIILTGKLKIKKTVTIRG